jgi:hypothetical protein
MKSKYEYDLDSAITFFMVGLGIGSFLAIVLYPNERLRLEGSRTVRGWRGAGMLGQERAEQSVA